MNDKQYNELISKSKFFQQIKQLVNNEKQNVSVIIPEKLIKLNIGAGPNVFAYDGWINYDRDDFSSYYNWLKYTPDFTNDVNRPKDGPGSLESLQKIQKYLKSGKELNCKMRNIKDGFHEHPNNSVDLIYCGQTIEHLNPIFEMPQFLLECFRMLKPNGVLRMTTPDLDLLIQAYLNNKMDQFAIEQPDFYKTADPASQLAYIMYGACGEGCTWQRYEGHFFLFTQKSMTIALKNAGFKDIEFHYQSGKSKSEVMQEEVCDAGITHSFIVECIK